jgi:hypothetical protein
MVRLHGHDKAGRLLALRIQRLHVEPVEVVGLARPSRIVRG